MKVEIGKEYQTRDGRAVRLFVTDARDPEHPVSGEYCATLGRWVLMAWQADGRCTCHGSNPSPIDLIPKEKRVKETLWINRYGQTASYYVHGTRGAADAACGNGRTECIRVEIDVPEGEGL
jgi:hypothetical protein